MSEGPGIHPEFPIRQDLSPPFLDPVSDCAEAVSVSAFLPRAIVRVWAAGMTELLVEEQPELSFAVLKLRRPVKAGEFLTTTQEAYGQVSGPLVPPVMVSALDASAVRTRKPDVDDVLYECGRVVPVGNLVPGGVRVHVTERDPAPGGATQEVGNEPAALAWHPVVTFAGLHADHFVAARQAACEGTDHEASGPPADEVKVRAAPSPTPAPIPPDSKEMSPAGTTVPLRGLLVGALVEVYDDGNLVGSGLANRSENFVPVWPPLKGDVTATQRLCGPPSEKSPPVRPEGKLTALTVLDPICAGSRFVVVRGSWPNALVKISKNGGGPLGYAGGKPGDLFVPIDAGKVLDPKDTVTALQYFWDPVLNHGTVSPPSNTATVVGWLRQPVIEVLGGEPFFHARAGEEPIDGPVFLRGRGSGPIVRVQACCSLNVRLQIVGPDGTNAADPPLRELFPGYFEAVWPWFSYSGWALPGGIPVGRYTAVVRTGCQQEEARAPFYVIFNPAEVAAPARFCFDNTAVWFGPGSGALRALPYTLHLQDNRVFGWAISVVNTQINQFEAARLLANAEASKFAYDLNYHANDTVDLLGQGQAQCADDACMLTALLRAVGIPAHPSTVDFRIEFCTQEELDDGECWTFDTWVEARLAGPMGERWYCLHSHQPAPGARGPVTRRQAGLGWGEVARSANDMVVMAAENWVPAEVGDAAMDISYDWNTPCKRPSQSSVQAAAWIENLTDTKPDTYWPKPYWECSPDYTPVVEIAVEPSPVRPGERAMATVAITNRTADERTSELSVLLAESRVEDKGFARRYEPLVSMVLTIPAGETIRIPVTLMVPAGVCTDDSLILVAAFGNDRGIVYVNVEPLVEVAVQVDRDVMVGDRVSLGVEIRNISGQSVEDIVLSVDTPFGMSIGEAISGEPRRRESIQIVPIAPKESVFIERNVYPRSELIPGLIRIELTSSAGCRRVSIPIVVNGDTGMKPSPGAAVTPPR